MKLLTFLGAGKYQPTRYRYQGQGYLTSFSPIASCAFLRPTQVIVFVTDEVKTITLPEFLSEVPAGIEVITRDIPIGADEQQLWQIFDALAGCVSPGEEVAFDITNGFRSFPLLGLLAAAFLRSGFNVNLRAVLYGAFDASRLVSPEETAMIDLTPMLTLLEWSSAADRFNRTGDARYLASLIRQQRKTLGIAAGNDPQRKNEAGRLGNLAGALEDVSNSLRLIRPFQVMSSTSGLPERVQAAMPALQGSAASQPFLMLLESIQNTYTPLGMHDPLDEGQAQQSICKQREIIQWYAEREQWVQVATLAREWMVNWVMFHMRLFDICERDNRRRIEEVINSESHHFKTACQKKEPVHLLFLRQVPQVDEALELWNILTDTRNDINHAGMRREPGAPEDLIKQLQKIIERINRLPLEQNV
jgi:hypothetical protein